MERLTLEQLARLVDERPSPEEAARLERDPAAQRELEALRAQTAALKDLPAVMPPPAGWDELRARLRAARLIRRPPRNLFATRRWLQAAAALIVFSAGTGFGMAVDRETGEGASVVSGNEAEPAPGGTPTSALQARPSFASLEEARQAVQSAEQRWAASFAEYQRLLRAQNRVPAPVDPAARLATMDLIWAASQAAVEASPGDVFLNSLVVSAAAERAEAYRLASQDTWR